MTSQIKSRQRVADHGEVLTGEREVNAMLDLVKQETERIESRFLEPACGTGNFLIEILRRKLTVVDARYKRSRVEWERNALVATSSIYGIDILEDNVRACRDRLLSLFEEFYSQRFKAQIREDTMRVAQYLLERNIIWGNALTLTIGDGDSDEPIVFSEWSPVNGSMIKRRDYAFRELFPPEDDTPVEDYSKPQKSLFDDVQKSLFEKPARPNISDTGKRVFIPLPLKDYPVVHFLELADAYK